MEILFSSAGATESNTRIDGACLSLEPTRLAFVHRQSPTSLMRFWYVSGRVRCAV